VCQTCESRAHKRSWWQSGGVGGGIGAVMVIVIIFVVIVVFVVFVVFIILFVALSLFFVIRGRRRWRRC
jgi:hypothetical protein